MVAILQQLSAGLYLAAGLSAGAGFTWARPRWARVGVGLLAAGALAHGLSFSLLHTQQPPPPLTHLPSALSFAAWVGTVAFLLLAWRARLTGLVALVAPVAFLGVCAAVWGGGDPGESTHGAGSLPHAHVLLASAGLALLGLAGLAGGLFLAEHRRLKRRRRLAGGGTWPSLEALDRAGAFAVAVGFPLLCLGVLSGALWQHATLGVYFSGSPHEIACLLATAVYGVLASLRFGARKPAPRLAASSVAGAACLVLALLGVEWLA